MLPLPAMIVAFAGLIIGGLILPGWLVTKLLRSETPVLSAFLGSAVILFYVVLGLEALSVHLSALSIGSGVALVVALLATLVTIRRRWWPVGAARPAGPVFPGGARDWLWVLPVVLALGAIGARAMLDPLSGDDTVFRWDFLARQLLREGTLAFYPPVSAGDFGLYGWCDGIPPLVSILHAWIYVSAGQATTEATAPLVLLEAGLLFYSIGRLALRTWGPTAAWPAAAVASTSALMLWGVAIGQETGLTALTLVAMFLFLEDYRHTGAWPALLWAGVAAGAGALCREYGLLWPLLGLAALACHGKLGAAWKPFAAAACLVAAPWYVRNWIHTGNPFYAHSLGGLFPVPAIHRELMATIAEMVTPRSLTAMLPLRLTFLALTAGAAIGLGAVGLLVAKRRGLPLVIGIAGVAALWFWSVRQTAGGWAYSCRVLTPAIALLAVGAGAALTRFGRGKVYLALGLSVLAVDGAFRSLYLPAHLAGPAWAQAPGAWLEPSRLIQQGRSAPLWKIIADAADGGVIVDHPATGALFAELGAVPVPLVSPRVAFLFDESLASAEILRRLRQERIRFLVLVGDEEGTGRFFRAHKFLAAVWQSEPFIRNPQLKIYDFHRLTLTPRAGGNDGVP